MLASEDAPHAAARVLARETGLPVKPDAFTTVCSVDGPGRDPRDTNARWVRTTVLWARVQHTGAVVAGGGAARARFVAIDEKPALAFDHDDLVRRAIASLESAREWASAHADPHDSTT
jgi:ADP-ribose pyrophosphatase YjhB (NUDIX family)